MASRHRKQLKERQIRYVTMCLTGKPEEWTDPQGQVHKLTTDRARAIACGWNPKVASTVGAQPEVIRLFEEIGKQLRDATAKEIVKGVQTQVMSRNEMLQRLAEIACMTKEEAGGTMHAQVTAACKYLDFTNGPGQTNGLSAASQAALPQAAWMNDVPDGKPS